MKKIVTLASAAVLGLTMFAAPATQVSAATTTPAQSTTTNQLSQAEMETINAAIKGSLITYPDSSGVAQVKIVDKNYLAQSLKQTNLKVTVEDVQSALDKVNSFAKNHPSEFTYENPLLRKKKKNTALCKNVMHTTGSALQTAWTAGSMVVGAGVPGYLIGAGFNAIFNVASWAC